MNRYKSSNSTDAWGVPHLSPTRQDQSLSAADRATKVRRRDVGAPLSQRSLRVVVALAEAGCEKDAARLTKGSDLVGQVRAALGDGDLITASDALQAALFSEQSIPQSLYDELPTLLDRYRTAEDRELYSATPGGPASAQATMAAYYALA
ncbi:hypothetical protein ABT112_32885 [Streptomyces sp. NPDC002055]|uniref:hypothetical protein n=1 Tax=Streptomyces sp. NPDC002055 TaxID=3154534 RepID=UPI003325E336